MKNYFVKYLILSFIIAFVSTLVTITAFADDSQAYVSPYTKSAFNTEKASDLMSDLLEDSRLATLWRLGMSGESFSTVNENSDVVGMRGDFLINYKLMENLKLDAGVRFNLESGYSQSIFGEVEPGSNIIPLNAVLDWQPTELINLKAGIVSQSFWGLPLLFRRIAFPGASQALKWNMSNKRFSIGLMAQQLIPTSATLATRVREREDTPQLFTETLELMIKPLNWAKLESKISLFDFNKLPHQVAFDSQKWGNTISNGGPNTAEFTFGFKGWILQNELELRYNSKVATQIDWAIIKNNSAPEGYNDAQMITPSIALDFGRFILQPSVSFYFIESDAVPSFYNDFTYGHNNRQGLNYQLSTEFKDWNVRFKAGLTDSKVINESFFQQDTKYIYLTMDMAYDII